MPATSSSDENQPDPRLSKFVKDHCIDLAAIVELQAIVNEIEKEAYFAESCNQEEFLRGLSKRSIARGETASARYTSTLAESVKHLREMRFPGLLDKLKKGSH